MFRNYCLLFLLSSATLFYSCKNSGKTELPIATGKLGSLVVVTGKDLQKQLQPALDSIFLKPADYLGGAEPFFELLRPDPGEFKQFFFNQSTIFVPVSFDQIEEMDELLEPFSKDEMEKLANDSKAILVDKQDVFAKYQHLTYLFGKDAADLQKKIYQAVPQLTLMLMNHEVSDEAGRLFNDSSSNDHYFKEMKQEFGLGVKVPAMFTLKQHVNGVYWFQADTRENNEDKQIGLIVHAYPYKDSGDLTYESIRSQRDSVCKYLVKGEIPGTYMGTTESGQYPKAMVESGTINGYPCIAVKGWWTIRGVSIAGPYIRYVVEVPSRKMLFAFEGFINRPGINVRERDVRLVQAIAQTIN